MKKTTYKNSFLSTNSQPFTIQSEEQKVKDTLNDDQQLKQIDVSSKFWEFLTNSEIPVTRSGCNLLNFKPSNT